jgi:hypothetical protein
VNRIAATSGAKEPSKVNEERARMACRV